MSSIPFVVRLTSHWSVHTIPASSDVNAFAMFKKFNCLVALGFEIVGAVTMCHAL